LLTGTEADDSDIVTVLFPGDVERDYYAAYHIEPGYGTPSHDPGGILGYELARVVIDGVLDADTGDVVELSEGRELQLRAILEERHEVT
jgi:hypothetical protein